MLLVDGWLRKMYRGQNIAFELGKVLMRAVRDDDSEALAWLLKYFPEDTWVNWHDYDGTTLLGQAVEMRFPQIVKLLLSKPNIRVALDTDRPLKTILMDALDEEGRELNNINDDIVNALLQRNDLDLNRVDSYGKTALYYAISFADPETIKRLLLKGASVNVVDVDGDTPLHSLNSRLQKEDVAQIAQVLLSVPNIQVNIHNKRGETPLKTLVEWNAKRNKSSLSDAINLIKEHGGHM